MKRLYVSDECGSRIKILAAESGQLMQSYVESRLMGAGAVGTATSEPSVKKADGGTRTSKSTQGFESPAPNLDKDARLAVAREAVAGVKITGLAAPRPADQEPTKDAPTRGVCHDCGRVLDRPMKYGPEHARACGRWGA